MSSKHLLPGLIQAAMVPLQIGFVISRYGSYSLILRMTRDGNDFLYDSLGNRVRRSNTVRASSVYIPKINRTRMAFLGCPPIRMVGHGIDVMRTQRPHSWAPRLTPQLWRTIFHAFPSCDLLQLFNRYVYPRVPSQKLWYFQLHGGGRCSSTCNSHGANGGCNRGLPDLFTTLVKVIPG